MTIPGVGPVTAMALQAFAPRLGRISKMGQRYLRRLLVTGAMAVVQQASRRGEITDPA